jgi:hypothetical protein
MPPRNPSVRKRSQGPGPHNQRGLSVRMTLLLTLSVLIALADAGLMCAAHQAVPLTVISAVAAFAAAFKFFDGVIE